MREKGRVRKMKEEEGERKDGKDMRENRKCERERVPFI